MLSPPISAPPSPIYASLSFIPSSVRSPLLYRPAPTLHQFTVASPFACPPEAQPTNLLFPQRFANNQLTIGRG